MQGFSYFYCLFAGLILNAFCVLAEPPKPQVSLDGEGSVGLGMERRQDFVYAVTLRGDGPNAVGSTPRLLIATEDNQEEFAPVSLGGDYVNSQGMMWRATAWVSALCASQASGKLLTDRHFIVRMGGLIDGPSAGMLMAATMLAQLTDTQVNPDAKTFATMTGAINADGTISPVGGIPVKLDGAAQLRDNDNNRIIKRFGYPVGSRFIDDPRTGKKVDLHDPKINKGIEVVELRDIYDAYQLLTGKKLERPQPVTSEMLSLSPELAADVQKLASGLRDQTSSVLAALPSKVDGDIQPNLTLAKRYAGDSVQAERQSRISEGMYRAVVSHALAGAGLFFTELRTVQRSGDTQRSLKLLASKIDEVKMTMGTLAKTVDSTLSKETVGGRTDALNAYLQFWECNAYWLTANKRRLLLSKLLDKLRDASLDGKVERANLTQDIESLTLSVGTLLAVAQSRMEVTRTLASLAQRESGKKVNPDPSDLMRLSKAYSFSAVANLELLNALFLAPTAEKENKSLESVLSTYELSDDNYALLRSTADAAVMEGMNMSTDSPSKIARAFGQLGSSLYALVGVTDMIQKNSTFDGRLNPQTRKIELTNPSAIAGALALANTRVLEEVAEVTKQLGFVPDSVKLNYDLGQSLQMSGSDSDRLTALRAYRRCYFLCSFARLLSGF